MSLESILGARLGANFADVRGSLRSNPNGPNGAFGRRNLSAITTLAIHHTAGPENQTVETIAAYHVDHNKWAGIGYHIVQRLGKVYYVGDAETSRACVGNYNDPVLCYCLTGNYEQTPPSQNTLSALSAGVAAIQEWAQATLGRRLKVLGHREAPGQQTACPGKHLLPYVHQLAAGGGGVVAPPAGPSAPAGLVAEAERRQAIRVNWQGALLTRMVADGFLPTSDEFDYSGHRAQRAEHPRTGAVRVYYARVGQWNDVRWAARP